ncbi:amidase [Reyranella soli]|uniref:Glutamyl-tRNA(Gln) amidotransferase subunit A n=1 Tax=Reyranella soli TaxID=1230389 RepID=A0A512NA30_9HYPH|nr:amidase [Reyranella soli]GEP55839.1 glutamyl-tRNA(Gln) amidotransferase subunit A [Reyranella soli]
MSELAFLTIVEASRRIAKRELSPVELTEACLSRIAALDNQLDSFVTVTAERARTEAKAAEAAIMASAPRSRLHGIPYCLKDIFDTAGIRTTAMSKLLADNVPTRDSHCQEKLAAAGSVLLGKNATWEFAHGGPSWDVLFPPARNPWDRTCSPAGSSSGSAAAVAAGLSPATLGSDTGGSIRGPAAACGIAGLKPTYGLVSRRGVLPNCFSQDHAGPLAWTTEDVAILLQAIAGHDPEDPGSADVTIPDYSAALTGSVKGMVIGVPTAWLEKEAPPSPATMAAFEAALAVFRGLGASVRPVTLPPIEQFDDVKKTIAISELFTIHAADLRTRPELFGTSLRYRIIAGGLVRAEDYIQAMRLRTDLARSLQAVLSTADVLMLPTAEPAGKLEPVPHSSLFTRPSLTAAFNVGGNPALSVCSGFDTRGLPFSLQIVGRLFDEATVLRAGDAYEKATPWRDRRPVF